MLLSFTLIACLLFIAYGVLIVVYQRVWARIPTFGLSSSAFSRPTFHTSSRPPVRITVLIPARNEAVNILSCLRSLAGQTYPKDLFEVIVLDDHSTDGTAGMVAGFDGPGGDGSAAGSDEPGAAGFDRLSVRCISMAEVLLPPGVTAYKKFAIETGVDAASGELIVTTDADCVFDPDWLATLAACYEQMGAKFIAAPVRIGSAAGRSAPASASWPGSRSLLGIFQTLDFITLQGITGAAVHSQFHSMCNGANLAYSRDAFYSVNGFKGIDHIPSGDDMLLMHKIYRLYPSNVFFLKSQRAIVSTRPETTWKGFLHQRVRWASKADSYDDRRIFWVLLLVYLVNILFVALLAGAFFNYWWLWLFLVLLVVKTIVEYPFVRSVATFFGQQELMVYFPLLQPLHILYTVVVGWLGKFGSYQWKDRTIKK